MLKILTLSVAIQTALIALSVITIFYAAPSLSAPDILLAKTLKNDIDINNYWASEKLDGVRAYWNGEKFISKQGNAFNAPAWFIKKFPKEHLDGELWSERQQFESIISTVKKNQPLDEQWQKMKFYVFELPNGKGTFTERIETINTIIAKHASPYLKAVSHYKIKNYQELDKELQRITHKGGEGLMLHLASSLYKTGRSNDLLKVKQHEDAEAKIISYVAGKGKYKNMLGSLVVETTEGIQFKIGTGFSDEERLTPPPIGSIITYRHRGFTKNNVPKFASYLRRRELME